MAHDKALKIPVLAINESDTKHLFDNRYGTGQSTVDGIIRTTNILLAGKRVVVCGYGWCSRGIASRMRGMGAIVTVTEVDAVKALEAVMDGFTVDQIGRAVRYGDLFVSATGDKQVISLAHMKRMKDGAILANSGHFNVEFDYDGLVKLAKSRRILRNNLEELVLPTGKRLYALGEETHQSCWRRRASGRGYGHELCQSSARRSVVCEKERDTPTQSLRAS